MFACCKAKSESCILIAKVLCSVSSMQQLAKLQSLHIEIPAIVVGTIVCYTIVHPISHPSVYLQSFIHSFIHPADHATT